MIVELCFKYLIFSSINNSNFMCELTIEHNEEMNKLNLSIFKKTKNKKTKTKQFSRIYPTVFFILALYPLENSRNN